MNEQLQCTAYRLTYSFTKHKGELFMAAGECCDMTGCISLFKAIDPDVELIKTWAGQFPDTHYRYQSGEWEAL